MHIEIEQDSISLFNEEKLLLKMSYPCDEFCITFYTNEKIIIDETSELYYPLLSIMNNEYRFGYPSHLTSKTKDKLLWYSDAYGDITDEAQTDQNSRLNILKKEDKLIIWAYKPLYEKLALDREFHCICFSPLGNGQVAINKQTGRNLQDEMVQDVYYKLIRNKTLKLSKATKN